MICSPYFYRDTLSLSCLNEQNTMNRMKHLLCVLLVVALGSFSFKANAYTERNLLQKAADETTLKNVLVMKQAWVPYPA